jgi:predicted dehydrogenase
LILGGGAIVLECHLPALKALGWLEHAVVVEPLERNAAAFRDKVPSIRTVTRPYQEALADPGISNNYDGVLVALPNTLHSDAVVRSLAAGLPVLCEKPLALSADECLGMEEAAEKYNQLLAVAMVRRLMPNLTAVREALRAGLPGEITHIALEHGGDCRHWPWDTETVLWRDQGGCLVNMGIHFLDYLEWTFRKLEPLEYQDNCAGGIEVNCDFRAAHSRKFPSAVADFLDAQFAQRTTGGRNARRDRDGAR